MQVEAALRTYTSLWRPVAMSAERRMDEQIELARLAYCEHMIRDTDLDPTEMKEFLCLDGQVDKTLRWLAFGVAKRRHDPDRVRGLLIYLVSNELQVKPDRAKRELLIRRIQLKRVRMQDLTIEKLAGTYLRWEHIFALVGKEFNPTREKARILEIYEELCQQEEQEEGRKESCNER